MTGDRRWPVVYWADAGFKEIELSSQPRFIRRVTVLLAVLALIAAACSSGSDNDGEVSTVDEPTPTPLATQPTPTPVDAEADPAGDEDETADEPADEEGDGGDESDLVDPDPTPPDDLDLSKPAFTESSKISTVGLDEIFFGMTADAAAEAAATAWDPDRPTTGQCWFGAPMNGPVGVEFMMWNGSVERVDITTEVITTRSGAGVGSTPEELRSLFGDSLDESDPALLAFVPSDEGDAEFRIFFEITDGAVSAYRAGRLPMIEFPTCP